MGTCLQRISFIRAFKETSRTFQKYQHQVNIIQFCVTVFLLSLVEVFCAEASIFITFFISNHSNAYQEAVEIFKEGKALPRWVENVVITASQIKGCSIDEDDIVEDETEEEDEDSDMSPRTNLDPSCEVNASLSIPSGMSSFARSTTILMFDIFENVFRT